MSVDAVLHRGQVLAAFSSVRRLRLMEIRQDNPPGCQLGWPAESVTSNSIGGAHQRAGAGFSFPMSLARLPKTARASSLGADSSEVSAKLVLYDRLSHEEAPKKRMK